MISDNNGKRYTPVVRLEDGATVYTVPKEQIGSGVSFLEFTDAFLTAQVGEKGYFVVTEVCACGSFLCRFTEKNDEEVIYKQRRMPLFGAKTLRGVRTYIVTGMRHHFFVRVTLKNGVYEAALRFILDGSAPYEDVRVRVYELSPDADYNDMAKCYRAYQLARGACRPIKERAKESEALRCACESIEIRIRLGWKPAPSPVLEQTLENEPEMRVGCTFDRVKDIIDELKKQGVDKAELCLVGWNKSGHDGRWPEPFPVEEKLGGEKKLRELIAYAQENGYQIVCHTNSTAWYNVSGVSKENVIREENGEYLCRADMAWSGGRAYRLCPEKALELAQKYLPEVAKLGFAGLHYIDVISTVDMPRCDHPDHPLTEGEAEEYYVRIGNLAKSLFGGFASEGGHDFAAPYLDYALYVTFNGNKQPLFDEEIPLWQLVYHGIILSNPTTTTVNYTIKDESARRKLIAFGGRPCFFFYSRFLEDNCFHWMGNEDLTCETDEALKKSVAAIKKGYDEYRRRAHLAQEFMESYRLLDDGSAVVTYADGTTVTVPEAF